MSGPIGGDINQVNNEVNQLISQMEGGNINLGLLSQTEFNIQKLLNNKNLPPNVREALEKALNDLKNVMQDGTPDESMLFDAKYELDQAVQNPQTDQTKK